jgi:hypothetical protein
MNRSDLDRLRDAQDFARHARRNAGGLSAYILADAKLLSELEKLIAFVERVEK